MQELIYLMRTDVADNSAIVFFIEESGWARIQTNAMRARPDGLNHFTYHPSRN
jgi:hypothetical protein